MQYTIQNIYGTHSRLKWVTVPLSVVGVAGVVAGAAGVVVDVVVDSGDRPNTTK